MAVTSVTEVFDGREGALSDASTRRYTRAFKVQTDSGYDDAITVTAPVEIPRRFAPYVNPLGGTADLQSLCRDIDARQDSESPYLWTVLAHYHSGSGRADPSAGRRRGGNTSDPGSGDGSRSNENPLLRPPDIEWNFLPLQKVMEKDFSAPTRQPVVNSAGVKFDPAPMREYAALVLTIGRNQAAYSPTAALDFANTVNLNAFFGFPALTALCKMPVAQLTSDNGVYFWRVTYTFHINKEGWQLEVLDQGYSELVGGKLKTIYHDATPVAQPVPLDGAGAKLAAGGTIVYRTFNPYPAKDFNDLHLP